MKHLELQRELVEVTVSDFDVKTASFFGGQNDQNANYSIEHFRVPDANYAMGRMVTLHSNPASNSSLVCNQF